jgi:hypothetical protein
MGSSEGVSISFELPEPSRERKPCPGQGRRKSRTTGKSICTILLAKLRWTSRFDTRAFDMSITDLLYAESMEMIRLDLSKL